MRVCVGEYALMPSVSVAVKVQLVGVHLGHFRICLPTLSPCFLYYAGFSISFAYSQI